MFIFYKCVTASARLLCSVSRLLWWHRVDFSDELAQLLLFYFITFCSDAVIVLFMNYTFMHLEYIQIQYGLSQYCICSKILNTNHLTK